ncbi:hypothetical protein [Metabacillus sediminilitoris]|uniref:Uncharacterized protein n=1 Tax=Metabacillus sediminilitoris TaxID=2567941 RepID=A0A4S4C9L9_9BACI|nr:hypothetical protein [Metabacillus sediminilitoris]QGQ45185.1 hypothetical protein GMB29_07895 [Metabacillus sediminilitoris]THF82516.1 hypothetical protein E6W99_03590 [Metabacillus sediminilitoris]
MEHATPTGCESKGDPKGDQRREGSRTVRGKKMPLAAINSQVLQSHRIKNDLFHTLADMKKYLEVNDHINEVVL